MPIPDFQSIMLPLLKFAADGKEHSIQEAMYHISKVFNLSVQELNEPLPSGREKKIDNRIRWARFYLGKAGLLESVRRGYFKITERGQQVLGSNPTEINTRYLEKFPEFVSFRAERKDKDTITRVQDEELGKRTPEELLEVGYQSIKQDLIREILNQIGQASPRFFERLVIDLLLQMGYGGSRSDAGKTIGGTGDEGIDGLINQDKLGLDSIYVQAKRWGATVGRPEIQKFVGALQPHRATKGIFITTSDFTEDAEEYASRIPTKIILIDGEKLAELMIEHNVGVSTSHTFEIKKIDTDYFTEE